MSAIRAFGGSALIAILLAGCTPDTSRSTNPLIGTTGTVQDQLRQQQLANVRATPGMSAGAVTGVNPGLTGIERAPDSGTGGAGGPVAGFNTTGTLNRPGVGAPETQDMPQMTPSNRQKRRAQERAARAAAKPPN